jgi:sensor c-di-GMP phosphodiesterase-like protein
VSLHARSPTQSSGISINTAAKCTLFNETRIGDYMRQVDVPIAAAEEQEMLMVVNEHRRVLNISDTQELMVSIAYAMPFELQQFNLFHVCLHIDATADSNKEGRPLVTLSSKDSYGKMFLILWCNDGKTPSCNCLSTHIQRQDCRSCCHSSSCSHSTVKSFHAQTTARLGLAIVLHLAVAQRADNSDQIWTRCAWTME